MQSARNTSEKDGNTTFILNNRSVKTECRLDAEIYIMQI